MQFLLLLLTTIIIFRSCSAQTTAICPVPGYIHRPDNEYCYQYYLIPEDFSAANRSCVRDGGLLVYINDLLEHDYLNQTFFLPNNQVEFWIGLNDLDTEGIFRWVNSTSVDYLNWATGFPEDNTNSRDCVKFSSDGWRVHTGFCATSELPHICKLRTCQSMDGRNCIGSDPTSVSSSLNATVIVIPVLLVIVVIVVIAITLVLLGLWKFNNDAFQRYCCCCLYTSSKSAIHSMQQENQRLRHELSQHKVSISGRFQPGQFTAEGVERELSGVPDGKGGVLPTIKQPLHSISESRNHGLSMADIPPPLAIQRPSLQSSLSRQPSQISASFFFGNPSTRPVRQSLPALAGSGSLMRADSLPRRPSVPAPVRGKQTVEEKPEDSESDTTESEEEKE